MKNRTYFLNGIGHGMKKFGELLNSSITSFFLIIVYVLGVGSSSLLAKVFQKKFLDISLSKKEQSYWFDLDITKRPKEQYHKQF